MATAIQQIPAPTLQEARRSAFICERFAAEGLSDVTRDDLGNVYGRLPGCGEAAPLVVTAHMDTVFPADTALDLRYEADRIYGPGLGDNSLGVSGLFALLWAAQGESPYPGDIWLVANVGEEGLGNLGGMRAVVDRFGSAARAYLVVEGMALGQVYHRGLSVQRYRITICTAGGHSWVDFGRPSAIHELAGLISRLCAWPLPTRPRTSLNVGEISGGTSINTIAAHAECLLDVRSEAQRTLNDLTKQVEALMQAANRPGVQAEWEVVGTRPAGAIPAEHPLVRQAASCLQDQGILPVLNIGSTDANLPLSRGLPAVCIGLTTGGAAHTQGEYVHTPLLERGLNQLLALVRATFELPEHQPPGRPGTGRAAG
jgi:acetylornithine deacetylase/succinyl-diaminopimelate desuccinylase-like protein